MARGLLAFAGHAPDNSTDDAWVGALTIVDSIDDLKTTRLIADAWAKAMSKPRRR